MTMSTNNPTLTLMPENEDLKRLASGIGVGLLAAGIGALYTVYARWGIAHGLHSPDLTALRFGVAGIVTLPILFIAWQRNRQTLIEKWKIWAAVSFLAGTPFGLLMFGAFQFAPSSHAAVFPFAAMSIMGMVLGAFAFKEKITLRRAAGIAIVLIGLLLVSGLEAASFSRRALLGDAMFILAGTLWASFGVMLRKHRLDPLLATAVIAFSALVTYVPVYLLTTGAERLLAATSEVFWIEAIVQGLIAGTGTLFTYARMVSILGPAKAAVFPALAPGLAALMAWPILGHAPSVTETAGLFIVMAGLIWAVTGKSKK
jgi:drug/metabolite transporter (DMT)-like permease